MSGRAKWLDVSAVAARLGVSSRHVRRLIEAGRFFEVRDLGLGKKPYYKISRAAVEVFEGNSLIDSDYSD